MLGRNLKQLLLEAWSPRAPALFPSQVAVAKAIIALPGSRYEGRAKGLTAFLNQILNQGRSCPKELQQDIVTVALDAAKARWNEDPTAPSTRELEALLRSQLPDTAGASSQAVTEVFLRQVRAREVVIVNPLLEGQGHPRKSDFEKVTVAGLLDKPAVRYLFLIDENQEGEILRQREMLSIALASQAEGDATGGEEGQSGRELFERLWKEGILRIKTIPSSDCIPVVAFDPHESVRVADIYFWDSALMPDDTTVDSIAKFGVKTKARWINSFYFPYVKLDGAKDVDWNKIPSGTGNRTTP